MYFHHVIIVHTKNAQLDTFEKARVNATIYYESIINIIQKRDKKSNNRENSSETTSTLFCSAPQIILLHLQKRTFSLSCTICKTPCITRQYFTKPVRAMPRLNTDLFEIQRTSPFFFDAPPLIKEPKQDICDIQCHISMQKCTTILYCNLNPTLGMC